eukprot:5776886-Amphidinium_carterae.1
MNVLREEPSHPNQTKAPQCPPKMELKPKTQNTLFTEYALLPLPNTEERENGGGSDSNVFCDYPIAPQVTRLEDP